MKKYVKCLDNSKGYEDILTVGKEYEFDENRAVKGSGSIYVMADDIGQYRGGDKSRFTAPYVKITPGDSLNQKEAWELLNLQKGDRVRVTARATESYSRGWTNSWATIMDSAIGIDFEITESNSHYNSSGVKLVHNGRGFFFPAFVLEKIVTVTDYGAKIEKIKVKNFKVGDEVCIPNKPKDPSSVPGWNTSMDYLIGKSGTIKSVESDGLISVEWNNSSINTWWVIPEWIVYSSPKTDSPATKSKKVKNEYKVGDRVTILCDRKSPIRVPATGTITASPISSKTDSVYSVEIDEEFLLRGTHGEWSYEKKDISLLKESEQEYKVGDKVVIVKNTTGGHKVGTECTIAEMPDEHISSYRLANSSGTSLRHPASNFTLIKTTKTEVMNKTVEKFKVGDQVRVVKNTSGGFTEGTIGIITSEGYDKRISYRVQGADRSYFHYETDLDFAEIISPVKEIMQDKYITPEDWESKKAFTKQVDVDKVLEKEKSVHSSDSSEVTITFIDYSMLVIG